MNSHKDLPAASVLYFGPYAFHLRQRLILDGDRPLRMGGRALDILQVLVEHAGRVVRKEQLIARVWPDSVVEEINLRVHIAALRRALGDGEKGQRYIVNVPQCGYSFIAPVHGDSVAQVVFDTLHAPQQNLPARLTPVIGRDSLVGRLVRQMPLCRLMTLTGPAGIGKSTVALRVAELLLQHYRDGVWYIDLSMLGDAPSLLEHLLRSLDLSFDTLASRHALLLLDNCDHHRDACRAAVETLLEAAPRLSILATCREAFATQQIHQALNAIWGVLGEANRYFDAGKSWNAMLYGAALKQGDLDWLQFVNNSFSIAMFGHENALYDAAFKEYFGLEPPARVPGFPSI